MLDKSWFTKSLVFLSKTLKHAPNFEDPETLEAWWVSLSQYSQEDLSKAFRLINERDREFPAPARVREAVIEAKTSGESGGKFSELLTLINKYGSHTCPQMEPMTQEVVRRMGGWGAVCCWTDDELQWRKKEFDNLYRDIMSNDDAYRNALLIAEEPKSVAELPGDVKEALRMAVNSSKQKNKGKQTIESLLDELKQ